MFSHYILGSILSILLLTCVNADDLPTCQPADFHYEYTKCDSQGGRWRVSVPKPNTCVGGAPNPPIRGQGCDFTCKSGQYLDIQGDQDCHACQPGTYSLGGGERFEDWDRLPAGFSTRSETFTSRYLLDEDDSPSNNCTSAGWTPQGKYISSVAVKCSASLVYTANLVTAGVVRFSYQFPDEDAIFQFMVQNSECQAVHGSESNKWPKKTKKGEWRELSVSLNSGMNVLYWKTLGIGTQASHLKQAIKIRNIEITGVAYTSQCTKCPNGTFSNEGASRCESCPPNTFSQKGAAKCTDCNTDVEYALGGSDKCTIRPPCKEENFFDYNSACDADGMTQKMYKWVEPKICKDTLPGSVTLPQPGKKEKCPPCNPGMELTSNGTCQFCQKSEYSDGSSKCQKCPASTAPEAGVILEWWNDIPASANLSSTCLSMNSDGCASEDGWQGMVDHIEVAKGHSDDSYLVLSLDIGGFMGSEQVFSGRGVPVGAVSFVFESQCSQDCTLFFMQQTQSTGTTVIKSWEGKQERQLYSYTVTSTGPVTFIWAFQKLGKGSDSPFSSYGSSRVTYNLRQDKAVLYSVNITNTITGGAGHCRKCPKGADTSGCIPCPARHYIDTASSECKACPDNTVVQSRTPWGIESCVPCGEGLRAEGDRCVSDCKYTSNTGQQYDFTGLSMVQTIDGARLFTASGTQYFHLFNISLCGNTLVNCRDNISYPDEDTSMESGVEAIICRTTIIPPKPGDSEGVMAAQPVSLGNILVNITNNGSSLNMDAKMKEEGVTLSVEDSGNAELDVHFTYVSEMSTQACRQGRTTTITMRCDVTQTGNGTVMVPPKCPDGTCDGCHFHFIWRSRKACPICKAEQYKVVPGECIDNKQKITYIPPQHCIFLEDSKALQEEKACTVQMPQWLQIVMYVVPILVGLGVLLIIMLCYCWMKNRKLEYKYMKLVANSSSKDGELPAAETCALDEDDDDDQFDAVEFKESKGRKFFSKLANYNKKDDMIPLQMPVKNALSEI